MKIYVDFDRTLFDCDSFLEDLYALVNKYNITKEEFRECQNQCKRKGFNPDIILDAVRKKNQFDVNLYKEIDNLLQNTNKYLFNDTIAFLEYLKSLNYEIIILTKGNIDYQTKKILNAKIDNYYNDLIVTMKHKGNLKLDYKNSVFIDDNPLEIDSIIKNKPKKIIYLKRDNAKYNEMSIKSKVAIVKSLEEIIQNKEL